MAPSTVDSPPHPHSPSFLPSDSVQPYPPLSCPHPRWSLWIPAAWELHRVSLSAWRKGFKSDCYFFIQRPDTDAVCLRILFRQYYWLLLLANSPSEKHQLWSPLLYLKPYPPCTTHSWQTPVCITPISEDDAYCHPSQNWYISIGLQSYIQLTLSSKLLTLDLFSAASSSWSPSSSSR